MTAASSLDELVAALRLFKPGTPLQNYITHIRFPRFKNIKANAKITFDFPVTALVGTNGSGKTSALHALYGAPLGQSTSEFWFSTVVDPIEEGAGEPNRYVYGHWLGSSSQVVETRKARVRKKNDPDYWEPTKATSSDGMDALPPLAEGQVVEGRSKDRWNPTDRPVLYLNFRSEVGAFDRFLHFGTNKKTQKINTKQDRIRLGASRLKEAIDDADDSKKVYGRRRVFDIGDLSPAELKQVSAILGKKYTSAKTIEHTLYGDQRGLSVVFHSAHTYSEAFAGSGEIAVVVLVSRIMRADKYSLILLDEPELSLHPAAQERLLEFLMSEVRKKHHQVVFSTHSPSMVRALPTNAVKVFVEDAGGAFDVINDNHPYVAFNRLGAAIPHKIRILVEDRLARSVVEEALSLLPSDGAAVFEVTFLPGGANSYYAHRIPTLMHSQSATYVFLDGDKAPVGGFPDPDGIPANQNEELAEIITKIVGGTVTLGADGGSDPKAQEKMFGLQRIYLRFLHQRVRFLPKLCPEALILEVLDPAANPSSAKDAKNQLKAKIQAGGAEPSSDEIDAVAKFELRKVRHLNAHVAALRAELEAILKAHPT